MTKPGLSIGVSRLGGLPKASLLGILRRGLRWTTAGAVFAAEYVTDQLSGDTSEAQLGVRVRALFQRVGGTAIKMGQQLSARSDMLPQAVCEALADLNDKVLPLDNDVAQAVIERELGRPIREVFREFDPDPIGSASIACVYRAWLPDGRAVAIKVQRPNIDQDFANDLSAFNLMTRFMEWSTFVRADSFGPLRDDLAIMFGEEMDFRLERRYQRLFSKWVADAGIRWARAPEVFPELSTRRVLVMEFIRATPAGRVIEAVEAEDQEALDALASRGIDPYDTAFRTQLFAGWARFEAPFFHADPHPGNIFIADGGDLIFIDFGACGMTSRGMRRNHTEVMRYALQRDASAMAAVMTSDTSPLPYLDIESFKSEMAERIAEVFNALDDEHATWSERVMSTLWLQLLEQARDLQLRMNLDTVRAIRAFLLYDTLSFRMAPELGTETLESYLADRARREKRSTLKELRETPLGDRLLLSAARRRDLLGRLERLAGQLDLALQAASQTKLLALSQGARFAQLALGLIYLGSIAATVGFSLAVVNEQLRARLMDAWTVEEIALVLLLMLLTAIRGRFSLNQVKAKW